MKKRTLGITENGDQTHLYTLTNHNEMKVILCDFGAMIYSIWVPDRFGRPIDVVMGYDSIADYERTHRYFGLTVGRIANRVENGVLTIDGKEYQMDRNDMGNSLHSGRHGASWKLWAVEEQTANSITFRTEDDHEQGLPGKAVMYVTYTLTEENGIRIAYRATCDEKTPFNMTNHTFFNLNGGGRVYEQVLQLNASAFTPVSDRRAIPTGKLAAVDCTPFDFREPKAIGADIGAWDPQLVLFSGYDHNLVLDKEKEGVEHAGYAWSPKTGIRMDIFTDCPGIQFYTANVIINLKGKYQETYFPHESYALETQYFPNCVNEAGFDCPVIAPGEEYRSMTEYRFSIF